MRACMMVIGSLRWDDGDGGIRKRWRKNHLDVAQCVGVSAPIYYGRKSSSRGNTFTMTLSDGKSTGKALLIPFNQSIRSITDLIAEAEALWEAEALRKQSGQISASWGCVGLLFAQAVPSKLREAWAAHYRRISSPVPPVSADGILSIEWPFVLQDCRPAKADIILATATLAEKGQPTPLDVARAWAEQNDGWERYFFKNIEHGIRTPDDAQIWQEIEGLNPPWIENREYEAAIRYLRAEAANRRE